MPPSVLLFQARNDDDPVRSEERQSFAAKTGLPLESIVPHDLLGGPPTLAGVRRFDALMIGGSGEYYVSKGDLPHFARLLELLREVVAARHPMFASCFGFQLMVEALGGEIVHDPASTEVGTFELALTEAGRRDELFGELPPRFAAQMGRKDRAGRLPPGLASLAESERNRLQAFRIPGAPIWATQFHPELDEVTNRGRFVRYLDGYAGTLSPQQMEEALARFHPSPEAAGLLPRFLKLAFDWG